MLPHTHKKRSGRLLFVTFPNETKKWVKWVARSFSCSSALHPDKGGLHWWFAGLKPLVPKHRAQKMMTDPSTSSEAMVRDADHALPIVCSLPELMNFKLFGKTVLVENAKFGFFLGHPLSQRVCSGLLVEIFKRGNQALPAQLPVETWRRCPTSKPGLLVILG